MLHAVNSRWCFRPISGLLAGACVKSGLLDEEELVFCIGETIQFEDASAPLFRDKEVSWGDRDDGLG